MYYLDETGRLMVVALPTLDPPKPEVPRPLFNANLAPSGSGQYTVTPDGKRFLLVRSASIRSEPMTVMLGWQDRLKDHD